jgi:hypothetical protein
LLVAIFFTLSSSQTSWFNGINVPWHNFGYDIGANSFDSNWFASFFANCSENHINSARFWVHCDGRASPMFNSDGSVSGLSPTFLPELEQLVKMASSSHVVTMLTLWSFDMCKQETPTSYHPQLISNTNALQSYVTKALIPILKTLDKYDNVVYEIINEPEWCVKETPGNTPYMASLSEMQRFAATIADAIHKNSRHAVTLGSSSLKWNSNSSAAVGNWWSDAALQKQVASSSAKLDFYQIHYYDWMHNDQWGYDPCREPASYWSLDKPTVVGELPATGGQFYTPTQLVECSFKDNYWGDMFWAYNADFDWKKAIPAWTQFYQEHAGISSYTSLVNWLKTLR